MNGTPHPISVHAALHVLMTRCFIERSLSKMKPRMQTIPANSVSLLTEIVGGCSKVMSEDEKNSFSLNIIQFELAVFCP